MVELFPRTEVESVPAGSDEWYTPKWLLDWIGHIDLDPCWSPASFVKADRVFNIRKGDDGLALHWNVGWGATIFVNPPYSNCGEWLRKCRQEAGSGRVIAALVPAMPGDGPWHKDVWGHAQFVGFIAGRVAFTSAEGETETRGRGHALVLWGSAFHCWQFLLEVQGRAKKHKQAPFWVKVAEWVVE